MTDEREIDDPLRYDKWIEDALRGVITRTLEFAAENGLPGEHHFYVTFRTDDPDVRIPDYLRAQHPEEMTIVLQHQFDDLIVTDEAFSVSVRFKGKPEALYVPLPAITAFADPSVNFGLQLKMVTVDEMDDEDFGALAESLVDEDAVDTDLDDPLDGAADNDGKRGEVIALDTFRKK